PRASDTASTPFHSTLVFFVLSLQPAATAETAVARATASVTNINFFFILYTPVRLLRAAFRRDIAERDRAFFSAEREVRQPEILHRHGFYKRFRFAVALIKRARVVVINDFKGCRV